MLRIGRAVKNMFAHPQHGEPVPFPVIETDETPRQQELSAGEFRMEILREIRNGRQLVQQPTPGAAARATPDSPSTYALRKYTEYNEQAKRLQGTAKERFEGLANSWFGKLAEIDAAKLNANVATPSRP